MNHIISLVIKYIYTAAITSILLTYLLVPSITLGASLGIALALTLVLYFTGDRYILPRFGNLPTVIFDFVLAGVIISTSNLFMVQTVTFGAALVTGIAIAAAEWLFHGYIMREIVPSTAGEMGGFSPIPDENHDHDHNHHEEHHEGHHDEHHEHHEGHHDDHHE